MKVYMEEHQGAHNPGHFLMDMCIPLYIALEKSGALNLNIDLIIKKKSNIDKRTNMPEILNLFSKKIKYVDNDRNIVPNKIKVENKLFPCKLDYKYCSSLSKFILDKFKIKKNAQRQITLLDRNTTSSFKRFSGGRYHVNIKRNILNLEELVEGLSNLGFPFECVRFGDPISIEEQLNIMQKTKVFVSYHGAGLVNTMFLPSKSKALELLPYGWVYDRYQKISDNMDIEYKFWRNKDKNCAEFNIETSYDTSVTPIEDINIIRYDGKSGKDLDKAQMLKSFFQHQNTKVNVKEICSIVKKML